MEFLRVLYNVYPICRRPLVELFIYPLIYKLRPKTPADSELIISPWGMPRVSTTDKGHTDLSNVRAVNDSDDEKIWAPNSQDGMSK